MILDNMGKDQLYRAWCYPYPCIGRSPNPEIEQHMLAHTPIRRLGEVSDIAGAVLYFASPVSVWVSGQTLFVNGGGIQTLD